MTIFALFGGRKFDSSPDASFPLTAAGLALIPFDDARIDSKEWGGLGRIAAALDRPLSAVISTVEPAEIYEEAGEAILDQIAEVASFAERLFLDGTSGYIAILIEWDGNERLRYLSGNIIDLPDKIRSMGGWEYRYFDMNTRRVCVDSYAPLIFRVLL